jgi:hypothetical protein
MHKDWGSEHLALGSQYSESERQVVTNLRTLSQVPRRETLGFYANPRRGALVDRVLRFFASHFRCA